MLDQLSRKIVIKGMETDKEMTFCAHLRASMDPWLTLERDLGDAIASLTAPDHEVFLAMLNDDIAGFLVLSSAGALPGFVLTLCITPDYQGYGVGSKLLAFAEQRIFKHSPNVFLLVSDFNSEGQAFYRKHSYKKVGQLEDYVTKGYSEILMRKSLAPWNDFSKSS